MRGVGKVDICTMKLILLKMRKYSHDSIVKSVYECRKGTTGLEKYRNDSVIIDNCKVVVAPITQPKAAIHFPEWLHDKCACIP